MFKFLLALMMATVLTILGAAAMATSYGTNTLSTWRAFDKGPHSTHLKTSDQTWIPNGADRGPSPANEGDVIPRPTLHERWI